MSTRAAKPVMDLPGELPRGEVVLWQGKPSWRSLAVRVFHIRKIGIYFALILVWRAALLVFERSPRQDSIVGDFGPLVLLAIGAIGVSALLAWLYSRTTTYTVTNRRVVMRYGAALPMLLNIPFGIIGAAGAKVHRDGTADIPLQLVGPGRMAYLHLWPHARPWHLKHPEPMLRSVPEGARIAALLANALTATSPPPVSQTIGIVPADDTASDTTPVLTPAAA